MKKREGGNEPPVQSETLLTLKKEYCQGCTRCVRICPTEAIRIRKGKAEIGLSRCIQCGTCITACPRNAWEVPSEALDQITKNRDAIAILDPVVFWQFGDRTPPEKIIQAFRAIGFKDVDDLGEEVDQYLNAVGDYLAGSQRPKPSISTGCPAVVQFIQVKFPSLIDNLIPLLTPYEIVLRRGKRKDFTSRRTHSCFIVPCLARAEAIRATSPGEGSTSPIPLANIFNALQEVLLREEVTAHSSRLISGPAGIRWGCAGFESEEVGCQSSLVVDGIQRVAGILELAENGLLDTISFIEAWACAGGCLGGPLTVQNSVLAAYHLQTWLKKKNLPQGQKRGKGKSPKSDWMKRDHPLLPRPGLRLDENLKIAMEKLHRIDEMVKKFPGMDCGSCGCPTCLALAEDVVQGFATEADCFYINRKR